MSGCCAGKQAKMEGGSGGSRCSAGVGRDSPPEKRRRQETDLQRSPDNDRLSAGWGSLVLTGNRDIPPDDVKKYHVVPRDLYIGFVTCKEEWASRSTQQKYYSHHFARAAWAGSRICATQLSEESPRILKIVLLAFSERRAPGLKEACLAAGIKEESWEFFIAYATCFLANMGNYLAFGDSKFIPGLPEDEFDQILRLCRLDDAERNSRLLDLWELTRHKIYSLEPGERQLGLPPKGVSMYYMGGITEEEVYVVQDWMLTKGIEAWNTRLEKRHPTSSGDKGLPEYDLLIASSIKHPTQTFEQEGKFLIHLVFGDHMDDLGEVVIHLKEALLYATDDNQRAELLNLITHFETGSINAHKEAQRFWIYGKSPVDANMGFTETYRDPLGLRAEFEGYVAIVNEEQTGRFTALANAAESFLPLLPWPKDFENEKWHKPDFSALNLLVFANGNIPAGVNIPNYPDVRQSIGFKNIVYFNVLLVTDPEDITVPFLREADREIFKRRKAEAMLVQVACHELLGHGSGKLFSKQRDGSYNYDHGKVLHPFTDEAVISCYGPGETWDTVFGPISSSYEECRAECVGVFFSANLEVLNILGHSGSDAEEVMYTTWLIMIRAGLLALEFYTPQTCTWRQAHMQARFAILQVLLAASAQEAAKQQRSTGNRGIPFLQLQKLGDDDALILIERDKIQSVGVPAITELLTRLQVYKSTADVDSGSTLYDKITKVPDYLLAFRNIVIGRKTPRPFFLQANTFESKHGVTVKEYTANCEGFMESFVDRFRSWIAMC